MASKPFTCGLCDWHTTYGNPATIAMHKAVSHSGSVPVVEKRQDVDTNHALLTACKDAEIILEQYDTPRNRRLGKYGLERNVLHALRAAISAAEVGPESVAPVRMPLVNSTEYADWLKSERKAKG